jgi:hypothetical protein
MKKFLLFRFSHLPVTTPDSLHRRRPAIRM